MAQFFVGCAIGFEKELEIELKSFWFEMIDLDGLPTRSQLVDVEIFPGGIQFECAEHLGYQINFFSKLAHRVLIRICKFEARYFDQFEKEFKKIDFKKWFNDKNIQLKIDSHKSRINNQKSIADCVSKILIGQSVRLQEHDDEEMQNEMQNHVQNNIHKNMQNMQNNVELDKQGSSLQQMIYIRADKDRFTISLDTSGKHLHKRGYAQHRGQAPLRETLAALMFKIFKQNLKIKSPFTILDPFVGSGTLLFEAFSENFPIIDNNYAWLKFLNRPKLFQSEAWSKNYKNEQNNDVLKNEYIGIDIDAKSIENLKTNLKLFKNLFNVPEFEVTTICADSGTVDLSGIEKRENIYILANPPYGHRLDSGSALDVLHSLEKKVPLQGMAVLHPESWKFEFQNLRLVSKIDFKNQGLRLKFSIFSAK